MTQAAVGSPCIGVCRMDEATGWCIGCQRTLEEIACWTVLTDDEKRGVRAQLGARRVQWLQPAPAVAAGSRGPL
jgi:hypothetical protein